MITNTACRAFVTPDSNGEYSIRFELVNPTSQPIELRTFVPFLQFRLRATVDGAPLAVEEPALDLPVHPVTQTVAASGTLELRTPMRLRFGGERSNDGFLWRIAHAREGVTLTFTLDLPAPFDQPVTAM